MVEERSQQKWPGRGLSCIITQPGHRLYQVNNLFRCFNKLVYERFNQRGQPFLRFISFGRYREFNETLHMLPKIYRKMCGVYDCFTCSQTYIYRKMCGLYDCNRVQCVFFEISKDQRRQGVMMIASDARKHIYNIGKCVEYMIAIQVNVLYQR